MRLVLLAAGARDAAGYNGSIICSINSVPASSYTQHIRERLT